MSKVMLFRLMKPPSFSCLVVFVWRFHPMATSLSQALSHCLVASVRLGHKSLRTFMKRSRLWYLPGVYPWELLFIY